MSLTESARDMRDELVLLRHALHATPELGLTLPRTQEKVLEALAGLPLEITTGSSLTSVTAVLRGGRRPAEGAAPVVLLRGDMDALPVSERNDLTYASTIEGRVMELKGVLESNDVNEIRSKTTALEEESRKLAEAMYAQATAQAQSAPTGNGSSTDDDEVVEEGEYEVIDEEEAKTS